MSRYSSLESSPAAAAPEVESEPDPAFQCFDGPAFRGRIQGRDVLILQLKPPVRVLSKPNNNGVHHVLRYEVLQSPTPNTQRIAFYLPTSDTWAGSRAAGPNGVQPGAAWLRFENLQVEEIQRRLMRVVDMVARQEADRPDGQPFFFPYLCPQVLVKCADEEPYLLGAPFDFAHDHQHPPPRSIERYVNPSYLEMRELPSSPYAPRDADRARFHRYGLGIMLLEAATGEEARPTELATQIDAVPAPWQGARAFMRKCLDLDEWDPNDDISSMFRVAIAPPRPEIPPEPIRRFSIDSDPFIHPPLDPIQDKPLRPAPASYRRFLPSKTTFAAFAVGLAIIPLVLHLIWGVNLFDPGEARRLRLHTLLQRWTTEDEQQQAATAGAIRRIDPNNLNLRYMELVQMLGRTGPTSEWAGKLDQLGKDANARGGYGSNDPYRPLFQEDDVNALKAMAGTALNSAGS
jgi:hypothetical protein